MNERLLQFIWQFQYYNVRALRTFKGESLAILHPGQYNTNQGPDFLEAKIKIDNTILAGNIELHLLNSDWDKHRHQNDINYNNVILHVVWEPDTMKSNSCIPVLVLQDRVPISLIKQYHLWMEEQHWIPCGTGLTSINRLIWMQWKERLLAERLERKAVLMLQRFHKNQEHWEETFWQLLASNFGLKINEEAFESIACSLPVSLLARHKNQLTTLESLLLGQAGLLKGKFTEAYPKLLQREYLFHQKKYGLKTGSIPVHFLRMRPASFPCIRLAQLAMLVHQTVHLFSKLREATTLQQVMALLNVTPNEYWNTHYLLDEPSAHLEKKLGKDMLHNIIINTVIPILYTYAKYHQDIALQYRAIRWLEEMGTEKNNIVSGWKKIGISCKDAYDSQALIELKTQYCNAKRCLDCIAGNALLKRTVI